MLAQQLPLGQIADDLKHGQGPEIDKVPPATPAVLPRDLPSRLAPAASEPLHFTSEIGGRSVEFRPVNELLPAE